MKEHNKTYYSLEELKRARDCYEGYQDGEEVYYFVGTLRYACDEIERLNNIINEFNNAYSKVITKCNQMINSRYYMNETAIEKYAAEIKDICYFYVEEVKELKGVDKE